MSSTQGANAPIRRASVARSPTGPLLAGRVHTEGTSRNQGRHGTSGVTVPLSMGQQP